MIEPGQRGAECRMVPNAARRKRLNTRRILLCVSGAVWFLTQTCSVDGVRRPRSPQLECQSVPVEQSSRQTQPRECTAQARSQEIALENTPVWRLIVREGGGKIWCTLVQHHYQEMMQFLFFFFFFFFHCTNQASVLLSAIRPDC